MVIEYTRKRETILFWYILFRNRNFLNLYLIMTIKESLKQIKLGNLKFVYFLKGDDSFLHSFFIEKVSQYYFKGSKHEKTLILPDEMSGKEIIEKLFNEDLFSTKELFIIRNPQLIRGKYKDDLIKYCLSPLKSKILILIIDNWFDKSVITRKISLLTSIVNVQTPFETEMRLWAKYFFKQEKISVNPDLQLPDLRAWARARMPSGPM